MANETTITVVGNITADPEFRTTPTQREVVNFTIASTPSIYDRNTNKWKDGEALFLRASAWGELASNIANTLTRGMRVIAQGNLSQHSYNAQDGSTRTSLELKVTEIGPSLRYATAAVNRTPKSPTEGSFNEYSSSENTSKTESEEVVQLTTQAPSSAEEAKNGPSDDKIFAKGDTSLDSSDSSDSSNGDPWEDKTEAQTEDQTSDDLPF